MANFKYILSIIIIILFAVPASTDDLAVIGVINSEGREIRLNVELARSDEEHRTGLMYRKSMPDDHGMLFIFNDDRYRNFWMKNTFLPLSIAYISGNCVINEIYEMKPLDTSLTYPSRNTARYALEVNSGWFTRHKIKPGCRIVPHGCIGQ